MENLDLLPPLAPLCMLKQGGLGLTVLMRGGGMFYGGFVFTAPGGT